MHRVSGPWTLGGSEEGRHTGAMSRPPVVTGTGCRRPWLAVGEALMALGAIAGSVGLATGTLDLGETLTYRLPFGSAPAGGGALLVVVGVPMTVAAVDAWTGARRRGRDGARRRPAADGVDTRAARLPPLVLLAAARLLRRRRGDRRGRLSGQGPVSPARVVPGDDLLADPDVVATRGGRTGSLGTSNNRVPPVLSCALRCSSRNRPWCWRPTKGTGPGPSGAAPSTTPDAPRQPQPDRFPGPVAARTRRPVAGDGAGQPHHGAEDAPRDQGAGGATGDRPGLTRPQRK